MQNESKLYGVVTGQEHISFVLDDFQCVFINSHMDTKEWELISQTQGFIRGRTTDGKYVYLHSGQDIRIHRQATLNTWLYFVSHLEGMETFQMISFEGGILDKLYFKSMWETDDKEPMQTRIKHSVDQETYALTNERLKGNLTVGSGIYEGVSAEKGNYISATETRLELSLEEEQRLEQFSELYGYVVDLCQFMAFRRNIRFSRIVLEKKSRRYPDFPEEIAECYVRYEEAPMTEKHIYRCILFQDLGECLDKLLGSIVDNTPQKPRFNIGFLPENDKDVKYITSMKIREVCSALESEMELAKIKVQQEAEFNKLVKELKKVVKAHREGEHPLEDEKSYQYISGTLDHMVGALADRIEKCFMEYQPLLGDYISRKHIDELVKYRNTITHGNYMQLDGKLAETAYVLMKLVYCCVLKRIGMEDEQIRGLMERNVVA